MPDHPRIEELKRRVLRDPASLAFAQLAEEYRRAGLLKEAVETCHAGLAFHPTYVSARVTLGRALVELGELEAGQAELKTVLSVAPENLAAIRGLADIHQRRGELAEALEYYHWALEFARHDPELEQIVRKISSQMTPPTPVVAPKQAAEAPAPGAAPQVAAAQAAPAPTAAVPPPQRVPAPAVPEPVAMLAPAAPAPSDVDRPVVHPAERDEARMQIALLQRWLTAILADRERRHSAS